MKIELLHKKTESPVFTVPEFNFGQMQRWVGKERLRYTLEVSTSVFIEKFSSEFTSFRENEILEDDPEDLEELIAYKKAGRPTLLELLENNHPVLKELIIYLEYELLHLLIENPKEKLQLFYSINSIDSISIHEEIILLEGICFEVNRNNY